LPVCGEVTCRDAAEGLQVVGGHGGSGDVAQRLEVTSVGKRGAAGLLQCREVGAQLEQILDRAACLVEVAGVILACLVEPLDPEDFYADIRNKARMNPGKNMNAIAPISMSSR
jgi:hypothetical protein